MKILAVCGMGIGSSMMLKINIDKALKELGLTDAEVEHCDLTSLAGAEADLIVVTNDLADNCRPYGDVIGLSNIMQKDELKEQLKAFINASDAS